jgi:multiple sugar transport system permease protein
MPFVWMVSTSFKYPADVMTVVIEWIPSRVTFANYIRIFNEYPVLRWLFNSVLVAGVSTTLNILFGAMAGYALARLHFPGRNALFFIFVASLMVPTEVTVVPLLLAIIKIGWWDSYQALICQPLTYVYSVYIFRQFFLTLARDLEDAAKMDGAGHFLIFWRIALPLARAPLIAATVIVFTLNWNNFLWPLLATSSDEMKTLPVGIAAFTPVIGTHTQLEGFALGMAGITVLSVPSLMLFFFLQRYFIQGLSSGAVRG